MRNNDQVSKEATSYINELLSEGFDLKQIKGALEDGATLELDQEVAEEAHDIVEAMIKNKSSMKVVDFLDDDSVKIQAGDSVYYVQTSDLQYRSSLGCLVLDIDGQDVDDDELVGDLEWCAEDYLNERFVCDYIEDEHGFVIFRDTKGQNNRRVKINDSYTNKQSSAYERRFESSESIEE